MTVFLRKLRYRFKKKKIPRKKSKKIRWQLPLAFLLLGLLIPGGVYTERRIGPLAQEMAMSTLNNLLVSEINLAATKALEEENIRAGSILQEDKAEDGTIENIVTDYVAANRVRTAIATRVAQVMEAHRSVITRVPVGAFFSDTLLTGFGIPIPLSIYASHRIEIQFLDTFDSAGINQTRQQLSLIVTVPVRIAGVFTSLDGQVSTEVPLAESVIIGTVPQTYMSNED